MTNQWQYREMGSRDRKTGKLRYYNVTVRDFIIIDCECEARQFRKFTPCKHMKRVARYTGHLRFS